MEKAFPPPEINEINKGASDKLPAPEQIKAVEPKANEQATLLAVVRDLFPETKRTKSLKNLGELGAKLLRLPKGSLWQATLVVNSERPNLTYTCLNLWEVGTAARFQKQDGICHLGGASCRQTRNLACHRNTADKVTRPRTRIGEAPSADAGGALPLLCVAIRLRGGNPAKKNSRAQQPTWMLSPFEARRTCRRAPQGDGKPKRDFETHWKSIEFLVRVDCRIKSGNDA